MIPSSPPSRILATALTGCLAISLLPGTLPEVGAQELDAHQRRAREILAELVELRTSAAHPEQTRQAMEAMAARLRAGGFANADVTVVEPEPPLTGLVARYPGSGGGSPILLMAHVDVVDAEPDAWSFPPFEFGERDGYYWGRGTVDNKAGAATLVANFLRLREEGFVPERDLVMVLTGDEETDGKVIDWVVREHPAAKEAGFALNTDAGGGAYDPNGEPMAFYVQTSEKMYQTFRLSATNPGGHSSVPRPENAIYDLAAALGRLAEFRFPVRRNPSTRLMFERTAELRPGEIGDAMRAFAAEEPDLDAAERLADASPTLNAVLRTTCVATMLQGGHAENALPRSATATVNCRVFPGVPAEEIEATLRDVIADDGIRIERVEGPWAVVTPPSDLPPDMLATLEELVQERWPGTPVVPNMSTGATDGLFVRRAGIPVYGVSAIFDDPDDLRAHGLDERIGVAEFHAADEFWYRMLRRLAGTDAGS